MLRGRHRGLLGIMLLALALAGCGKTPQSMLDPQGPVARTQLRLFTFDLVMITGTGAVVAALILYVILRYRARPGSDRIPAQVDGNPRLEIAWTVAAALVLVPLLVEPLRDEFALAAGPGTSNPLTVEVVGHQWWWEFRYPELGIVTATDLHIPAGRSVQLKVTTADVMHSFWVPRLGGKIDAVPGRENTLWLQADEPGTFLGQCAELCGTSHANMRFRIVAQSEADFDQWVKARKNPPPLPTGDLAARAEARFKQTCAVCHTIDGTPYQGKVGPNLTGVAGRSSLAGGILENTPENLRRWLSDPPGVKPGSLMPNYNLSKEEIDALVQFLSELK